MTRDGAILRVGILGTAAIAKKNALAIKRSAACELVAVASRSAERARAWCEELNLELRQLSYDEMVRDTEVDAVYVPLPTSLHVEWVLKLAAAKKHVLVEKPVGRTLAEVETMVNACRAANVALMDGTMFMHHDRFKALTRLFESMHWKCERFQAAFSFFGGDEFFQGNIRTRVDGDPLGCLGDVGWYCARFALAVTRFEAPQYVVARLRDASPDGVPFDMDVDLLFASGTFATFHCSFKHHLRSWFEACSRTSYGARIVRCFDFVIPRREEACDFEIEEIPDQQTLDYDTVVASSKTTLPFYGCCQEKCMWDAFAALTSNDARSDRAFYEMALLRTHQILEAAWSSAKSGGAQVAVPDLQRP